MLAAALQFMGALPVFCSVMVCAAGLRPRSVVKVSAAGARVRIAAAVTVRLTATSRSVLVAFRSLMRTVPV
jgi:hypothetical protein